MNNRYSSKVSNILIYKIIFSSTILSIAHGEENKNNKVLDFNSSTRKEKIKDKQEKTSNTNTLSTGLSKTGWEIKTNDGYWRLTIGGFEQGDGQINFNTGDASDPAIKNGAASRRTRIRLDGVLYRDFGYKFEYDFVRTVNQLAIANITESWVSYTHLNPVTFKIGQIKEPLTLISSTSDRYLEFIERPLFANAFIENPNPYKLGISVEAYNTRWTTRAALQTQNTGLGVGIFEDTRYQLGGRITGLPIYHNPAQLVHLGISGSSTWIRNKLNPTTGALENPPLTYSSQPFANVDRTPWTNTGPLTAGNRILENVTRLGAELSLVSGPFSFQGEYMQARLTGVGYSNADVLDGYYGTFSYFFTGESRVYDHKIGAFTRVEPKRDVGYGGWGAWEVAIRWDQLNMNTPHVSGGNTQMAAIGLNWYLNPHIRLMADYGYVVNEVAPETNPMIAKFNGLNPSIIEVRAQVDF
ncbi:OprO/OprP family phosphate-selective porin [Candidatus Nitrosacidococcus tergens]|uniref:Phosphate-selective porin O and P n=1 Tax=Candidatus Nitrosacidococcus tergens TaxID=553981 RepID=A0A7G1Q816_9GAMM|nr:porin [Candidatus Nitrosacidococcus tergens]CAB1274710.1 Phosphate-selective porin O and P [Candidatus Nitrosacidococcus tergens]